MLSKRPRNLECGGEAVDKLCNHLCKDVTRDPKNSLDKVHGQVNKS